MQPGQQYPLLRGPARYVDPESEKERQKHFEFYFIQWRQRPCKVSGSQAICFLNEDVKFRGVSRITPWHGRGRRRHRICEWPLRREDICGQIGRVCTTFLTLTRCWTGTPVLDCLEMTAGREEKRNIINVSDRVWNIKCPGTFFGNPQNKYWFFRNYLFCVRVERATAVVAGKNTGLTYIQKAMMWSNIRRSNTATDRLIDWFGSNLAHLVRRIAWLIDLIRIWRI